MISLSLCVSESARDSQDGIDRSTFVTCFTLFSNDPILRSLELLGEWSLARSKLLLVLILTLVFAVSLVAEPGNLCVCECPSLLLFL